MNIPFIKMNGAGNDFVFLEEKNLKTELTSRLVKILLDRHFGVGGDQLLVLKKSRFRQSPGLDIYNADGSKAEMCGNGVRAVAHYLLEEKGFRSGFVMGTSAGPIGITHQGRKIEVDMGRPVWEGTQIPARRKGAIVNYPLTVAGRRLKVQGVSMGNPHCIVYVSNVSKFPVAKVGPLLENHRFFPHRVNAEFVEVKSRGHVRARVWERGAGETLACGTGACAIVVACARSGKTDRKVKVSLPGGDLRVRWARNGHVFLAGPVEINYEGIFYAT